MVSCRKFFNLLHTLRKSKSDETLILILEWTKIRSSNLRGRVKAVKKRRNQTPFWIGPFLAGGFVAIGYGVTQRVMIIHTNTDNPSVNAFAEKKPFPGKALTDLKSHQNTKITPTSQQLESLDPKTKRSPTAKNREDHEMQTILNKLEPLADKTFDSKAQESIPLEILNNLPQR